MYKLLNHVSLAYKNKIQFQQIYAWSDSTVVLCWLKTSPHLLQTFEGNRVQEIINSKIPINWRYVPTTHNPADCGSRGISGQQLLHHKLWWDVPWLSGTMDTWPINNNETIYNLPGLKRVVTAVQLLPEPFEKTIINKYSSFSKIVNVTAWVLRFINNLKSRNDANLNKVLSFSEFHNATRHIIFYVQSQSFSDELIALKGNKPITTALKKLNIFLDADGIIRVGGRLKNAPLRYDSCHQILLPKHNRFVQLLIEYYHKLYCHAGTNGLIAILRNNYWIVSIRREVSSIIHKCIRCFRFNSKPISPLMADLPIDRVSSIRAFHSVGTDFAGPYLVKASLLKNAKSVKAYLCVFICTATKAVHLEVVSSLSVEAFVAAFTRFVSRRGLPSIVRSDNGSNFVGANKELKELYKFMLTYYNNISDELKRNNINWKFNPPQAPHFGGLFESAVKSSKNLLKRVIGEQILTFEELSTLFAKIEAILNSRPLTPISEDPMDLDILTPGHFLIGQPLVALPEYSYNEIKASKLSRFQLLQQLSQSFWSRFYKEYLNTLQIRNKWYKQTENLQINDLVLIKDDALPPLHWRRGRILNTFSGKDGIVRSIQVKTQFGTYIRPVLKVIKLPI